MSHYLWNETPISVRNASRFFPLIFCWAASLTLSKVSQQAMHGSVFTLAKDWSSFRGLKSFFFCLLSCSISQETMAKVAYQYIVEEKTNITCYQSGVVTNCSKHLQCDSSSG